jgi:hypothetical protein
MPRSVHGVGLYLSVGGLLLLLPGVGGCAMPQSTLVPTPTKTPRPIRATACAVPTINLAELPTAIPTLIADLLLAAPSTPAESASPTHAPAPPIPFVANGWLPLSKVYDPVAPPRLNENKFLPNVHSGERSQEISFDWRSGEAGIFRAVEVVPGR